MKFNVIVVLSYDNGTKRRRIIRKKLSAEKAELVRAHWAEMYADKENRTVIVEAA